jgi:putative ABC transport system permease protein
MLKNYLRIALRTLRKHPLYTAINVSGLAVGMACCLLIVMLVRHEWSYDRFHTNADRIYRTTIEYVAPGGEVNYQNMMTPAFTPLLKDEFPAIEQATRFVQGHQDVQVGSDFHRQRMVEVDPDFFTMFTFPFRAGDPGSVLDDPSGMVITEDVATTFFGVRAGSFEEALGETVSITRGDRTFDFIVTGVAAHPPATSSLDFEVAISFENYDAIYLGGNNWGGRTSTYILLEPGTDPAAFEEALVPFVDTQSARYQEALRSGGFLAEGDDAFRMRLQPLAAMHLSPDVWVPYEAAPHNPLYSYILVGIGLLVLGIACINFMTLSVGRSTERAKEVGVRKALGAHRGQLARQFWGEALVLTAGALVIGVVLALGALPFFNDLTGQDLVLSTFYGYEVALGIGVLLAVVGVVAGGYPAWVLARFQPAAVLKGEVTGGRAGWFTRSLVVLQYTISIGLIVATVVMSQQLHYLLNKDLGYNEDLVMVVEARQVSRGEAPRVLDRFRNELLPYDQVTHVERAGYAFTRGTDRNTWQDASGTTRSAYNFGVGVDYVDLMDMTIVAGRNFSRDFPGDSTQSVLVNEALVREFGIEDPIGTTLTGWLDTVYDEAPTIIGVVEDFHFQSLREAVEPAVLNMHPDYYNYMGAILLRIRPGAVQETIQRVEATWAEALPGKPFTYSFLDDDLASQYQAEQRWRSIITYASVLAILIACLGLFGLATLTVARRTKEIGIRKVLGASVTGLMALIAREFALLVGLATLIAWPLAYWGLQQWLQDFAYRIGMPWWAFPAAGAVALAIAVGTVGLRALQAARLDPARALRSE